MDATMNDQSTERVQAEDLIKKPVWGFEDYVRDFMMATKSHQPPAVSIARGLANLERLTIALEYLAVKHGRMASSGAVPPGKQDG